MENEQVLAGDAAMVASSKLRSRQLQRGHDIVTAASGGIEIPKTSEYEYTPLLLKDQETDDGRSDSSGVAAEGGEFKWQGEDDFKERPWWNTPSVYWMLPPFFLYTLAFGGIVVPRLNLILSLICHEYFADQSMKEPRFHFMPVILGNDNPQCQIPEVQSLVAKFTLYGNLIAGLLSAITSPKIGSLSDRYGRKRLIAFSISGMLAGEIITIIAATMPEMFSVQWLFVGYVFEGLCGSFTASMALTYAYASDCTPPVERNVVFGWLHGCLFGGIAIGPLMAGYIVKVSGKILTVFYLSLACHCVYLLFIILVVPESLTEERQLAAREKKAQMEEAEVSMLQSWPRNWLSILKGSNVFAPLMILYPKGQGSTQAVRRNLVLLAAVDTITFGVAMGSITVMLIYAEFVFGWGTFETSIFVSVVNTSRVAVLLLLLPLISRLFRSGAPRGSITASRQQQSGSTMFDISLIRVSVLFDLLGYIGFASVRTRPLFILSGVVASIGGMGSPTLSAALTKHVPQDRTGQMLGAMGLLHALARVVAPTVFNLIYSLTVGTYPQIVFICLGSMFGVAFLLSWGIRPNVHWDPIQPAARRGNSGVTENEDEGM